MSSPAFGGVAVYSLFSDPEYDREELAFWENVLMQDMTEEDEETRRCGEYDAIEAFTAPEED